MVVLQDFMFVGCPPTSFFRLADRLLSIVANSATCERLFSVFGNTLTKLRNRMETSTLSSLAELKMHIRDEHQEKSTKIRMKNLFGHRSKNTTSATTSPPQPPPLDHPGQREPAIDLSTPLTPEDPTLGLRHLIPNEITGDEADLGGATDGPVSLKSLFNFDTRHWVNLYDEYAKKHLTDELELCELLNRDAATDEGAEVDVDEMTGDILMG
jgi:hypothetical protein